MPGPYNLWFADVEEVSGDSGEAFNDVANAAGEPDDTVATIAPALIGDAPLETRTKRLRGFSLDIPSDVVTALMSEGVTAVRLIVRGAENFQNSGNFRLTSEDGSDIDVGESAGTPDGGLDNYYTPYLDAANYPLAVLSSGTFKVGVWMEADGNLCETQVDAIGIEVNGTPPPPPPPPPTPSVEFHLHHQDGDDANDGLTAATRIKTLAKLYTIGGAAANGAPNGFGGQRAIVYCAGVLYGGFTSSAYTNNVTFQPEPGETWENYRRDLVVLTWADEGGGVWSTDDPTNVYGVMIDPAQAPDGCWTGHYLKDSGLAEKCYDITGGKLKVHMIGGGSPTGHAVWLMRTGSGIALTNCSNVTIKGLKGQGFMHEAVAPYGVQGIGNGITYDNCDLSDAYKHDWGMTTGSTTNCLVSGGVSRGSGFTLSPFNNGSNGVFHSIAGVSGNSNNRCYQHLFISHTPLGPDGLPLQPTYPSAVALSHTGGDPAKLDGITWEQCTVLDRNGQGGWIDGTDNTAPSDVMDWRTHTIIVKRSGFGFSGPDLGRGILTKVGLGGDAYSHVGKYLGMGSGTGTAIADVNCAMRFTSDTGLFANNFNIAISGGTRYLIGGYIWTSALVSLMQFNANATIIMENMTIVDDAALGDFYLFNTGVRTVTIKMGNCLGVNIAAIGGSTRKIYNTNANVTFEATGPNAWYGYSDVSQDPGAIVLADIPLLDYTVGPELTRSAIMQLRTAYKAAGFVGINKVKGNLIGCWQKPIGLSDRTRGGSYDDRGMRRR